MNITPSILIATRGLLSGQALTISPTMTGLFNKINLHPMIAPTIYIKASAYSSSLASLATFIVNTNSATVQVLNRAQNIFTGGVDGTKILISLFNTALGFCSTSQSYYSAIEEFSAKNFSDFGIKSNSYQSLISNNLSSLFPNIKSGSLIQENLAKLGTDLANFGSAYDFTDLLTFGPQNLMQSLYNQNLTSKSGINDAIRAEGYEPANFANIPEQVLINILATVTDSNLEHVLKMLNVRITKNILNLSELLNVENLLRPETLFALNLRQNDPLSIKKLGNSFLNLGISLDLETLRNLLLSAELNDYEYLDKINFPLPADIAATLKANLGTGSGLYQNPTVNDLIGTVAGETHILAFKKILDILNYFTYNTTYGSNLVTALTNLQNAIIVNDLGLIASTQATLASAISSFNSAVSASTDAQSYINTANQALLDSENQLIKERNNMLILNIDLSVRQTSSSSILPILNFAQNLHNFGQDINFLGTFKFLNSCSSTNLYGNAVNSCLFEGRNIQRSQYVAKNTSTIANQISKDKQQANKKLVDLNNQYSQIRVLAKDGTSESAFLENQMIDDINSTKRIINGNPLS